MMERIATTEKHMIDMNAAIELRLAALERKVAFLENRAQPPRTTNANANALVSLNQLIRAGVESLVESAVRPFFSCRHSDMVSLCSTVRAQQFFLLKAQMWDTIYNYKASQKKVLGPEILQFFADLVHGGHTWAVQNVGCLFNEADADTPAARDFKQRFVDAIAKKVRCILKQSELSSFLTNHTVHQCAL